MRLSTEARCPGSRVLSVFKGRWSGGEGGGWRGDLRAGGGGIRLGLELLCLFKTLPKRN